MLSLLQIDDAIEREARKLGDLIDTMARAYDAQATAEIEWKARLAQSRNHLRSEHAGTRLPAEWFEDQALALNSDYHSAYLRANAQLATLREERAIRVSRLDALRTLSTSARSAGA